VAERYSILFDLPEYALSVSFSFSFWPLYGYLIYDQLELIVMLKSLMVCVDTYSITVDHISLLQLRISSKINTNIDDSSEINVSGRHFDV